MNWRTRTSKKKKQRKKKQEDEGAWENFSIQFVKCNCNGHKKHSNVCEHIKCHRNGRFSHISHQSVHPESPPISEPLADLSLFHFVRVLSVLLLFSLSLSLSPCIFWFIMLSSSKYLIVSAFLIHFGHEITGFG